MLLIISWAMMASPSYSQLNLGRTPLRMWPYKAPGYRLESTLLCLTMKSGGLVFFLVGLFALCAMMPSASAQGKPGNCPIRAAVVKPPCIKWCDTDYDCPSIQKCCSKFCSMVCENPIN
uniref:scuwaprin-a-like n=1 Tax=Podarcis muralis TaxID=64176 RepID=UPI00109F35A9|nr:scuwaprin-a-like [Podarcis muralis]